jgi:hypothetical protein
MTTEQVILMLWSSGPGQKGGVCEATVSSGMWNRTVTILTGSRCSLARRWWMPSTIGYTLPLIIIGWENFTDYLQIQSALNFTYVMMLNKLLGSSWTLGYQQWDVAWSLFSWQDWRSQACFGFYKKDLFTVISKCKSQLNRLAEQNSLLKGYGKKCS